MVRNYLVVEPNRACRVALRQLAPSRAPIYHHDYTYTTTIQRARFKIFQLARPTRRDKYLNYFYDLLMITLKCHATTLSRLRQERLETCIPGKHA